MNRAQFAELNAFIAVAERTNFARAADHLGITASTISQTIRALEERLGMRLLNRTTRSVSLTDAGEKLLQRISPAIKELGAAVEDLNEFRDTPRGTLRLSVSSVAAEIVLAPVIKEFLAAYPAISLDITIDDSQCRYRERTLRRRHPGRAARRPGHAGGAGHRADPRHRDRLSRVPVTAPGAEDTGRICSSTTASCYRKHLECIPWEFAKGKSKFEMSVTGSLTVNSMDLVVRAVLDGVGIGYTIESYVAAHIAAGRLVPLLLDWSPGTPQLLFVLHRPAAVAGAAESVQFVPAAAAGTLHCRP